MTAHGLSYKPKTDTTGQYLQETLF